MRSCQDTSEVKWLYGVDPWFELTSGRVIQSKSLPNQICGATHHPLWIWELLKVASTEMTENTFLCMKEKLPHKCETKQWLEKKSIVLLDHSIITIIQYLDCMIGASLLSRKWNWMLICCPAYIFHISYFYELSKVYSSLPRRNNDTTPY